ncbi:mannosyltransferase [Rhodococcus tibetensis]|uniref:Mannosyltransferase n=1 Tax=Rhodococcus tibetensis TaxID=2965064 RepID=A0ABT1QCG9_9NOCA|nr:mannosyltransferase [Rhodococcus sp. FXJ9.536]MCQ4119941.1 mannosyltransferase [Rhodococcus sp. FXJ9.536]
MSDHAASHDGASDGGAGSEDPSSPSSQGVSVARALLRCAPVLLALSVLGRMAWTLLSPNGMNLVDLHVYVDGSEALGGGSLYDFTYSEVTPDFPLPFTYPPFAALVFFPLHFLPFGLVGVCWQLLTILALYALARLSLSLVLGAAARRPRWQAAALLWTTVGVWLEPVRTTLDYGQINVFLALLVMTAVRSSRWWLSGALVGFAAGIKLTPAITGLYFLLQRRWKAAVFSGVAFAATVGISYLLIGSEAREYFTHLLGDADRIGPVGSVWNQSLRGALSRLLGYDVGTGAVWLVAVVVTVVLAVLAWRALARDDRLGTLVIVELLGLLVSPISWSHHWVWVIPMLIWLLHGPYGSMLGTRIVAGYWLVTTLIGVPWVLSFFQDSIWLISRPAVLAWLGTVDVVGAFGVYAWVAWAGRRTKRTPTPPAHRSEQRDPDRAV